MKRIASTLLASLLLAGSAMAADPIPAPRSSSLIEQLRRTEQRLASDYPIKKGAVGDREVREQRRALRDVIQRLEAGETVRPQDLDKALGIRGE